MSKEKDIKLTFKEQWATLKFILGFLKPFKWYFVGALFFGVLTTIFTAIMPFILSTFMDQHLVIGKVTDRTLVYFSILYFSVAMINAMSWFFRWITLQNGSNMVNQYIRGKLYDKLLTLGMRYFDQKPTGWLITRVTNDTDLFQFWTMIFNGIISIISIIISFIALFYIDVPVTFGMMVFLPILFAAVWLYNHISTQVYKAMRKRLSELNTKLNEYISGMRIIQEFRQETRLNNEFDETNDEYYRLRMRVITINGLLLSPMVNFLMAISIVVVLFLFGNRSTYSLVEGGLVYAFIQNVRQYFNPITGLMDSLSFWSDGMVASSRIRQILNETEYAPAQHPVEGVKIVEGKIEFRHVNFSYDGVIPILKDISFVVNPGETLAFVGHTGSGKSSIINVFMRFYEFGDGQVLIDDRDIRDYSMEELRHKIGLVLQDSFIFVGNVADNIRMMNSNIPIDDVIAASEFVQANHFIEKLPNGYETQVIEGGDAFSSGERQLLNFARTIVRNPKILLLDEATASIDTETEALIQDGLEKMSQGRTTMVIAHRLSTIKDADQILVLDKGKIIEQGTHDELLVQDGYYADMYRIQTLQKGL
ncbi:ABC transporter ATP-binding protein [Lactovum miscens]|uniref:ATP-binding cassette subfamily B protein n=1 Tax=Lactovum miscens TaxID=190387 RepID=A0A841CB09_9LACT|nr:ABC transporter ATP-binding protein [Lactovum miscens]MBB5888579.1 ATP-binding cassette subfamily B protein [Lactovum miscens]